MFSCHLHIKYSTISLSKRDLSLSHKEKISYFTQARTHVEKKWEGIKESEQTNLCLQQY